jgi:hypothetical protein
MTDAADTRWRRDMFEPGIVHLPDPDDRVRRRLRSGLRWTGALCERYVRVDSREDTDTHRCPDCAARDQQDGWESPGSGGGAGPGASL